ncbi:MAG: hypothetical protein NTW32_13245 [Chloroflexi bacterium]|nr:hypothetical protein [Chloroflexota bacterium]
MAIIICGDIADVFPRYHHKCYIGQRKCTGNGCDGFVQGVKEVFCGANHRFLVVEFPSGGHRLKVEINQILIVDRFVPDVCPSVIRDMFYV